MLSFLLHMGDKMKRYIYIRINGKTHLLRPKEYEEYISGKPLTEIKENIKQSNNSEERKNNDKS